MYFLLTACLLLTIAELVFLGWIESVKSRQKKDAESK